MPYSYVDGFDHFCEFVGNDIGKGNLGCFVTFLVSLAALSSFVVFLSTWQVLLNFTSVGHAWNLQHDVWRLLAGAVLLVFLIYAVDKCRSTDVCGSVLPLIMMMPGATVGAGLILFALASTIVLPIVTNMIGGSPNASPVGFFLILP